VRPPVGATRSVESYLDVRSNATRDTRGSLTLLYPKPLRQVDSRLRPDTTHYQIPRREYRVWQIRGNITSETPAGSYVVYALAEGTHGNSGAAQQSFIVLDATVPQNLTVGVIRSYDNTLESALRSLGAHVEALDPTHLPFYDLSRFNSIFIDMRAYLVDPGLVQNNNDLLDYCRNGGNLVVMYQKTREWRSKYAPYPLEVTHHRVTVEQAPVHYKQPDHPLLNWPNKLGPSDWGKWKQERGLYFPGKVDEHYVHLIEMHDPGEPPLTTGWLVADVGKGSYIYTSLVWYRQLRAGLPGAYRALANMAAYPLRPR